MDDSGDTNSTSINYAAWRDTVRAAAVGLGFAAAGFTSAEPLEGAVQRRWERWFGLGRAGRMAYLLRRAPRRTHPRDLLPEAQSVIVVAASYYDGDHPAPPAGSAGKVARYAWGRDYHGVIRARLDELGRAIADQAAGRGHSAPVIWRAVADSAPLDERGFAVRAGLGFIGKNTLLLHPERGSWMLLGALLVSLPFPEDHPEQNSQNQSRIRRLGLQPDGALSIGEPPCDPAGEVGLQAQPTSSIPSCGSCRKCLDACPTGAFPGPYELDATRCISYLTIEQREPIEEGLAGKMEGWAFGCDICQEVCPFNAEPARLRLPELARSEGIGPYLTREFLDAIPSGKALEKRWGHTPISRPGLAALRRNVEAAGKSEEGG